MQIIVPQPVAVAVEDDDTIPPYWPETPEGRAVYRRCAEDAYCMVAKLLETPDPKTTLMLVKAATAISWMPTSYALERLLEWVRRA